MIFLHGQHFPLNGKTFWLGVLGCRTNHYEAEALCSMLERGGAIRREEPDAGTDILLLVTCSITSVADAKTRKALRRLRRAHPDAVLAACGCYAQAAETAAARELGVDILVGNRRKGEIPGLLERWNAERAAGARPFLAAREDLSDCTAWDALDMDRPRLHTRAFLKVQDGCSRGCSYCIVPRLRGRPVSRDPDALCAEASRIAASGCREIILTGIHLGCYRYGDVSLGALIGRISALPGIERLRLGSLEPFAVDGEVLRALAESKAFCPHLHLPLQSGDDGVLRRMRRGYDAAGFADTVRRVREALGEDIHLSTDLIVGFPGEDDAAFANSLRLLETLRFGKVHVFPFSARAGTAAAEMSARVPPDAMRLRVGRALELSRRLLAAYAAARIGRPASVLAERVADGAVTGWTERYLAAACAAPDKVLPGDTVYFIPQFSRDGVLFDRREHLENITFGCE